MSGCGCCSTPAPAVPIEVENRPGLAAVVYRLGTFASFRHAVLSELARTPELAGLRARGSDDFTITAVELWSAVADILTFYQERIINEAFLRTARLRDSVVRLVRLLDYQLDPGRAATTDLAFTLEPQALLLVPVGLRVQSVPAEGEKPQKFETIESIAADARLNRLRLLPRPLPAPPLSQGSTEAIVAPDAEALAAARDLAPGKQVAVFTASAIDFLTVAEKRVDDDLLAVVWAAPLHDDFSDAASGSAGAGVYQLGRSFRLYGHDAPFKFPKPTTIKLDGQTCAVLVETEIPTELDPAGGESSGGSDHLLLDGHYAGLARGARLAVVVSGAPTKVFEVVVTAVGTSSAARGPQHGTVTRIDFESNTNLANAISDIRTVSLYELIGPRLRWWPFAQPDAVAGAEVFVPGRRSGWSRIEVGGAIDKGVRQKGFDLELSDLGEGRRVIVTDARGSAASATIAVAALAGSEIAIGPTVEQPESAAAIGFGAGQCERVTAMLSRELPVRVHFQNRHRLFCVAVPGMAPITVALVPASVAPESIQDVPVEQAAALLRSALRGARADVIALAKAEVFADRGRLVILPGAPGQTLEFGPAADDDATFRDLGLDAASAAFVDGVLSGPIAALAAALDVEVALTVGLSPAETHTLVVDDHNVDGVVNVDDVAAALGTALPGAIVRKIGERRVVVLPAVPAHEERHYLRLTLRRDAPIALERRSAVLLGNVARASHGETVRDEILGDGDAAQAFQRFALKKKPVTHLTGAGPRGSQSSLRVLVNGVRWREVASLYGCRETDDVYTTRFADDGTLTVQFGDGRIGARLRTGRANLVASYRQGLGLEGRVRAATLKTLLDRPNGLKAAINPLAADGGADAESMDAARRTAPGTVRTFGRAVSLRDFEDIALATREVAKASAMWAWTGQRRAVHLTIAAHGGAAFSSEGLVRLRAEFDARRDPSQTLLLDNAVRVAVTVRAHLRIDENRLTDDVLRAAREALLGSLSFEAMPFGRAVHLSEVIAVLQGVDGVVAVDLDDLDFKSLDALFRQEHGATDAHPQPHLRVLSARPGPTPADPIRPAEQAFVEIASQDVILTASGGLSS